MEHSLDERNIKYQDQCLMIDNLANELAVSLKELLRNREDVLQALLRFQDSISGEIGVGSQTRRHGLLTQFKILDGYLQDCVNASQMVVAKTQEYINFSQK